MLRQALIAALNRDPTEEESRRVVEAGQRVAIEMRGRDGWHRQAWDAMEREILQLRANHGA